MGVTGLLPFLKKSTDQINISQFSGMTAAIDAYVWLHRGAFSCAEQLAKGESTTSYIGYGLKMLHMLMSHNIKPILVFDGRRLEAKSETEAKRYELRKQNKQKAETLLKAGRENEARDFLRRSVDITHKMAVEFIKVARNMQVDCIVAPHEADAQMAYLNHQGIANFIITEDSDLILFGCSQILYKLDVNGNGMLLRLDRLHMSLGRPHETPQALLTKLRHICILSGCDYVSSLPGVGLVKAKKFIMATSDPDFCRSIKRLPMFLNLRVKLDEEYIERVRHAELTFRRQLVFDPRTRRQLLLDGLEVSNDEPYSGKYLEPSVALSLALGNIDPFTMEQVDNFNPDLLPPVSMWHENYTPPKKQEPRVSAFVTTQGKEVIVESKQVILNKPKIDVLPSTATMDQEMTALYSTTMHERVVAQSEVKTSIFDGLTTREVVQSSYFSEERVKVEDKIISSTSQNSKQPPEFTKLQNLHTTTPRKTTPGKILSIIDETPSPVVVNKSPLARNPFAKKLKLDDSPKYKILDSVPSGDELTRIPTESLQLVSELDGSLPESAVDCVDLTGELDPYGVAPMDCQSTQSSGVFSQLDSQGEGLLLSSQASAGDSAMEVSQPSSPILGKRRWNENQSPTKEKTTSSYFSKPHNPFSISSSNTISPAASLPSSTGKRNLSSLFQWSMSQEKSVTAMKLASSAPNTSTPRSVGLRKVTKTRNSLYSFGFTKK